LSETNPDPGEDDDGRNRLAATIGGGIALVLIVGLGIRLVNELADAARYSKCAAARHRNCDDINYRTAPPPQQ
jgi:hypothetical protein